ncbi:sulfotransferase family 2 domain-containing protein [Ruegeria jejuensis]|uniref:sulfotransferase family 2 domain-containing protein n=1 Tax=Ruegeria jejuensis TaxID=3233338 RepID=UPI00355B45A1
MDGLETTGLDNRTILDRTGLGYGQKVMDRLGRRGELHLHGQVGDVRLGYCYIRKNACSSFKRLFMDLAEADYDPASGERPIDFLVKHQMMRSVDAPLCDRIVFVYRDPVARIVSLFKNKFIMRSGHEDLFRKYPALAGEDPDQTTFRRFATHYLREDFTALDRHVLPQVWHLKRFRYTDAIPIGALHDRMRSIIGQPLADQYFSQPVNATKSQKAYLPKAMDIPSAELSRRFTDMGTMPQDEDFIDASLRTRLETLYSADSDMIRAVKTRAA